MSRVFGRYGPRSTYLAPWLRKLFLKGAVWLGKRKGLYRSDALYATHKRRTLESKLNQGETVYLLGIGVIGHNTGVALIKATSHEGLTIISNHEEERFSGVKHDGRFPKESLAILKKEMCALGLSFEDIHCVLGNFDYLSLFATMMKTLFEHYPFSFPLLRQSTDENCNYTHIRPTLNAPNALGKLFGRKTICPIIGMSHHENHAYFSYAISPFVNESKDVLVSVIDGTGDESAISLFLASQKKITKVYSNESVMDSLGMLYGYISATQGGWSFLSSEGRYMGAAAWGDNNRLTNPYYSRLRQLCYFGEKGTIHINKKMAGWHLRGQVKPYRRLLKAILGRPIRKEDMWDPDAVLCVDEIKHSPITETRVNKAAALQMVFEDALCHLLGYYLRHLGVDRLILSGGTALNCVANSVLLEQFDSAFYERYLNKKTTLSIWVPPVPADTGTVIGAAYHFAMKAGASSKKPFPSPFLCGLAATSDEISLACANAHDVRFKKVGSINDPKAHAYMASFLAYAVANSAIVGLYQGRAETGPRALGHRSILANPCDPCIRDKLNQRVKYREKIRPLAPMMTLAAAKRYYYLSMGASHHNFTAYDYMVLTVKAKTGTKEKMPAIIHQDGTSRIQIVRQFNNPFVHAFLIALGREIDVEAAVNTSLNVGSPIVQTPEQAITLLSKAKGMTGLMMISAEQDVWLLEHSRLRESEGILSYLIRFKAASALSES